jgi:hypothetical protein
MAFSPLLLVSGVFSRRGRERNFQARNLPRLGLGRNGSRFLFYSIAKGDMPFGH